MKIEISIEGPVHALTALRGDIRVPFAFHRGPHPRGAGREEMGRIVLEEEEGALEERLLEISCAAGRIERELDLQEGFRFRTRNTAYSEPPAGSDRFRESFNPIPTLTIQPWDPRRENPQRPGTILIDCRRAFGTGTHPTTRLCLQVLETVARKGPSGAVLDFGCGTGLLAVAAVSLGFPRAVGVEIDPQSVQTAMRNVRLNALEEQIEIRNGSWEAVEGRFDLVLANLVPSVLLRTGDRLPDHLEAGGAAVISGFGVKGADEMEGFFTDTGLVPGERYTLEDWACLVMSKPL